MGRISNSEKRQRIDDYYNLRMGGVSRFERDEAIKRLKRKKALASFMRKHG